MDGDDGQGPDDKMEYAAQLSVVSEGDESCASSAFEGSFRSLADSPHSSDSGREQWQDAAMLSGSLRAANAARGGEERFTRSGSGNLQGSPGGVLGVPMDSPLTPIKERPRAESWESGASWESRVSSSSRGLQPPPNLNSGSFSSSGSSANLKRIERRDDSGSFTMGGGDSGSSFVSRSGRRKSQPRRRRSVEEERREDRQELDEQAKELMERRKKFEDHLMKIPRKNRAKAVRCNCTEEQLQSPVWKFLINVMITGKGEPDPLGIRDAEDEDFIYEQLVEKSQHTLYTPGPVGDLPMHMVFLLAYGGNTPKMLSMGKRLIEEYYAGDDINMAYTSDLDTPVFKHLDFRPEDSGKYTGETVLHIAIVNKDLDMVRWLLNHNASLESRATGAFFRPHVIRRRSKRARGLKKVAQKWIQNRDLKSEPFMKERLNLEGAHGNGRRYFGEFPLSFAASMGHVEMCQLLHDFMARADDGGVSDAELQKQKKKRIWRMLNAQDDLGNTAMHMAVMHRHKDVFDWLHANGAESSMSILNEDALTPFTLAVRNGFTDMYTHIYKKYFSDIVFKFGEMQLFKTSLEQIDTFRIEGFPLHSDARWRSALEVITIHEVSALSRDSLYNELIQAKWSAFGLRMFLLRTVLPYALYVALFTVATWFRCRDVREGWRQVQEGTREDRDVGLADEVSQRWQDPYVLFQLCTQILLVFTSLYILVMGVMTRRLGPRDIDPDEDGGTLTSKMKRIIHKNLIFILNTAISVCVIGSTGFRITGSDRMEMAMLAVGNVLIWCNFLQTLAPIKPIGVLVILIWRIAVQDVLISLTLYMVMLCAFSGAQFVMYQRSDHVYSLEASGGMRLDEWPTTAMFRNVYVSMGEVNTTDLLLMSNTPWLVLLLHITWIVVANVLMMNLLIAMMSNTIDDGLQYAHEMWIFPFAREVLRYERMMKEESTMVGVSIWRPSYSIKLLVGCFFSYSYKLVKRALCCVGRSRPIAPVNPPGELQRGPSLLSWGRQQSVKAPPVKPRYDQTRRRQFLVNRTGESDQTHKKFMAEEEISTAKFYHMELTLPHGAHQASSTRAPDPAAKGSQPLRVERSTSISTSSQCTVDVFAEEQKQHAQREAMELEAAVSKLRDTAQAMDLGGGLPASPLQRRVLPDMRSSLDPSALQMDEAEEAAVLREATKQMDASLLELHDLCAAIEQLSSAADPALGHVIKAGDELVRLKAQCSWSSPSKGDRLVPAKHRRLSQPDATNASASSRVDALGVGEAEVVGVVLPGAPEGDAGTSVAELQPQESEERV